MRGDEDLGDTTSGDEIEGVGHWRALGRGDRQQLGLPAAPGDPEHAGTHRGLRDAGAEGDDLARELEAGDVGR